MATPKASRFGRLQTMNVKDGPGFVSDIPESIRLTVGTAQSSARFPIRGEFELFAIHATYATTINASAKTVNIGTSASATRFAAVALSAGSENERTAVSPASADVPNWISTGSANAVTTVRAAFTDASGVAADFHATLVYFRRS